MQHSQLKVMCESILSNLFLFITVCLKVYENELKTQFLGDSSNSVIVTKTNNQPAKTPVYISYYYI